VEVAISDLVSKSPQLSTVNRELIHFAMTSSNLEISVTIKLFAVYQEAFGTAEISCQFPQHTPVKAVLARLTLDRPELAQWHEVTRFGINMEFVDPDTIMHDRDEVVLIPPVSGG
jgi:sulfur-carrier protein